jgi:hypothetical protein
MMVHVEFQCQFETPAERLRELDKRMWEKYSEFLHPPRVCIFG